MSAPKASSSVGGRRIDGQPAFAQAISETLRAAAERGDPELWLCDRDFAAWPLGARDVVDSFNQWVLNTRQARCVLVASSFDELPRQHARWVAWRQPWAHRVACLQVPEELAVDLPCLLLAGQGHVVEVFDTEHWRGVSCQDPVRGAQARDRLDAISQRSGEALPPTTLGL